MDDAISQFLTKGTAVIVVIVVMANFFVKRIVESIWPRLRAVANEMDHKPMYTNKAALIWNQIGLYALPVVIGGHLGLFNEPFLFGEEIQTTQGRVFFAAVVGWFADFGYEVVQKTLLKTTGVKLPNPDSYMPSVNPLPGGLESIAPTAVKLESLAPPKSEADGS